MQSLWQTATGRLACSWAEAASRLPAHPQWLRETGDVKIRYWPPPMDYASHSPFGGTSWFGPRWGATPSH